MVLSPAGALNEIDRARVGVFAWRTGSGPRACGITPFVDAGRPVVTSTLAFTSKMAAVRREPRVALLAGGVLMQAMATVSLDLDGRRFGHSLLAQEVRKYPPTAQLGRVPGHRRLFSWYFGRVIADLDVEGLETAGPDERTVTTVDASGFPRIAALDPSADVGADRFEVEAPDGPAVVLVHRESDDGARLAQLTIGGTVTSRTFVVRERHGSADVPPPSSTVAQLRDLRAMGRLGKAGRSRVRAWT